MLEEAHNIVIIARGKNLKGEVVITYCKRNEPDLKRIILKKDL